MNGKVLLVDDMEINRLMLENMMKDLPVKVDCAAGAEEAWALLAEQTYDLCFFDHRMPGKDGVALLRELRVDEDNPNHSCPCVAMTGDDFDGAEEYFASQGFDRFLLKPPEKAVLYDLVWEMLGEKLEEEKEELPVPEEEIALLPPEIRENLFLDCLVGLRKCGNVEGYLSAINIFMEGIDENAQALEESFADQDILNYTIKVHGLKSTARMIGAISLADQAAAMEEAGDKGDFSAIAEKHSEFMIAYKRFQKIHALVREEIERRNRKKVILASVQESFSICAAKTKLSEAGIESIYVQATAGELQQYHEGSSLILYYTDNDVYLRNGFHNFLKKLYTEKDKRVIVIGNKNEYSEVLKIVPQDAIYRWLERPVDMGDLLRAISSYFQQNTMSDLQKKQILIVDDDETYVRLIQEWLRDRYEVRMAHSGEEAIRWLAEHPADLVLLDYEMPAMDGPQVLSILKKYSNTSEIPVMFLTGKKDRSSVMKAMGLRPSAYVLKTIDRASLLSRIQETIG